MTLSLLPDSVIEERPSWTLAVNRNPDLLGQAIVVLRRHCTSVIDIAPHEWALLWVELRRLVPALDRLFHPDQFNFAFLMNLDSQVHIHVVTQVRLVETLARTDLHRRALGRSIRPRATAAAPGRASAACRRDPRAARLTLTCPLPPAGERGSLASHEREERP